MNIRAVRITTGVIAILAGLLAVSGCQTRSGTQKENLAPSAEFVNIPPSGSTFSGGALLYWVGRDADGQVVQYRLAIVRDFDIAALLGTALPLDSADIESFISTKLASLTDTVWNYLPVTTDFPATGAVINLYADLKSPVLTHIPQVVFLQAFDEQGKGSNVAFRRLQRFDNPPQTTITNFNRSTPPTFINAVAPNGNNGIGLSWRGSDPIDFPAEAPPFEFEWKLFGPFTQADSARIRSSVVKTVFVTNDGQVFIVGESAGHYITCDTVPDGDTVKINCVDIDPDTLTASNPYGKLEIDSYLDLHDPDWDTTGYANRIADSSSNGVDAWVTKTRDSMFNVFRTSPGDSTIERKFILWVRARDDAKVPDLTPAYVMFSVIDAKYENRLGIFNMIAAASTTNGAKDSTHAHFWDSTVAWYAANGGYPISFDTARDYHTYGVQFLNGGLLRPFLSYQTLILFHDDSKGGAFKSSDVQNSIGRALAAGVNCWYIGRSLGKDPSPAIPPGTGNPPPNPVFTLEGFWPGISTLFGAIATQYTGWDWHIRVATGDQKLRVESFIGTYTFDEAKYPSLLVDTLRLEKSYSWTGALPFRVAGTMVTGALPEVNWFLRDFRTELTYLYRANDTLGHPLGPNYFYNAKPIAFRWDKGVFRTAFWGFNPLVMQQATALPAIRTQLNWFFEKQFAAPGQPGSTLSATEEKQLHDLLWPTTDEEATSMK